MSVTLVAADDAMGVVCDAGTEFVRKKYDPFLTAHTPDLEAAVFLKDLITVRGKNTIDVVFQFVYQTLAADKAAEVLWGAFQTNLPMCSILGLRASTVRNVNLGVCV